MMEDTEKLILKAVRPTSRAICPMVRLKSSDERPPLYLASMSYQGLRQKMGRISNWRRAK